MSLSYDIYSIVEDLRRIEYTVEELEEDYNRLVVENERLKTMVIEHNSSLYDLMKQEFVEDVMKMYSLEELQVIFKKKQGYPLTKII